MNCTSSKLKSLTCKNIWENKYYYALASSLKHYFTENKLVDAYWFSLSVCCQEKNALQSTGLDMRNVSVLRMSVFASDICITINGIVTEPSKQVADNR